MKPKLALLALVLIGLTVLTSCQAQRTPKRLGGGGRVGNGLSDSDACRTEGMPRPFGRRFTAFGERSSQVWQKQKDDIPKRFEILDGDLQRMSAQRAKELETAADLVSYVPIAVYVDASLHSESLTQYADNYFQRAKKDAGCFLSRLWYDLKILE